MNEYFIEKSNAEIAAAHNTSRKRATEMTANQGQGLQNIRNKNHSFSSLTIQVIIYTARQRKQIMKAFEAS